MQFRTDYFGHDHLYQKYKAEGQPGWNDEATWLAWKAEIEALLAYPGLPKSGSILELGCGAGNVALLFAEKGYQASGIDISPTAIDWAREKAGQRNLSAEFAVGDVTDLRRWEDGTFDIAVDGHCLHCIIGEDRGKVLRETHRVLKSGGLFYVSTMCGDPKEAMVLETFDPESRCRVVKGIAVRYFGRPESILEEVRQAGFRIDRHEVRPNEGTEDDLIVWARR